MTTRTTKRITIKNNQYQLSKLANSTHDVAYVTGKKRILYAPIFEGHIENYIGLAQVPIGLMGPILINGEHAKGEFYVPMATTEGTLIASYSRGATAITESGGCRVVCVQDQLKRVPGFIFSNLNESQEFSSWCYACIESIRSVAASTSNYADLCSMRTIIEGNYVFLELSFKTADAAGQNMVTIAVQAILGFINELCPVKPKFSYIDANVSGDKKVSFGNLINGRGKRIIAEVIIPKETVTKLLHLSVDDFIRYTQMAQIGSSLMGGIGVQGHYVNGLAAIFLATGQDIACVAESSTGITKAQLTDNGDLNVSVSLSSLVIGTVGGGTGLPTQRECLMVMDCFGKDKVLKLAEICGASCLAGEISLIAAMASGEFARAHQKHGRRNVEKPINNYVISKTNNRVYSTTVNQHVNSLLLL